MFGVTDLVALAKFVASGVSVTRRRTYVGHSFLPRRSQFHKALQALQATTSNNKRRTETTMTDPGEEDRENEQVRVYFRLAADCHDASLQVPADVLAVPSHLGRKGLSTVINHLLDRRLPEDDDDEDDDERLSSLTFDFLVGHTNHNRLLRTSVEKEARQYGLSLEDALTITYFPAQLAPEPAKDEPPQPDWISDLCFASNSLTVASYDGSLRHYRVDKTGSLQAGAVMAQAHEGPIKCVRSFAMNNSIWTASGAMDHTLALHEMTTGRLQARVQHKAAVASVDERVKGSSALLASGDWEGGIFLWDVAASDVPTEPASSKKRRTEKTSQGDDDEEEITYTLSPKVSLQAHQSKVSGIAWGNHFKKHGDNSSHLLTASWDHAIKVWDVETSDCLLTLNGSKVVSCLDTSHHTAGIVATGHPDCTIRLWDVRTDQTANTSSLVSDTVFRPSHRAWISQVQWSDTKPYQVLSSSHDGTVKVWDIRASLPLHTVRVASKEDKVLALGLGSTVDGKALFFAGGTECQLKQFSLDGIKATDKQVMDTTLQQ
jgi:ribosome biogenesis protein YTM1